MEAAVHIYINIIGEGMRGGLRKSSLIWTALPLPNSSFVASSMLMKWKKKRKIFTPSEISFNSN